MAKSPHREHDAALIEGQCPMQPAFVARSDMTKPSLAHFDGDEQRKPR